MVSDGTIDAEVAKGMHANLGEDLPRPIFIDAVEHPSDGIVVEHLRSDILSEKECDIPGTEELFHPVKGRSPRENIHDKPEKDRSGAYPHAAG